MLRALDLSIRPSVRLSVIFAYGVAKLSGDTGEFTLPGPQLLPSPSLHPG